MSINSINSSVQNQYPKVSTQATSNTTVVKTKTASALSITASDTVQLSQTAKNITLASTSKSATQEYDFTNMSPNAMKSVGNEMFKQGKIDIDQLFQLENAGVPLGKLGPNGQFVALTPAEREDYMSKPVNYVKYTADRISFLEQTGYANDSKSGYEMLTSLLGKLKGSQV
jgi:hypothetical protein